MATYGALANALGSIRASRWIAMHLNQRVDPERYPLHRVIRSTGDVGTYIDGRIDIKRELLLHDKIPFKSEKVDLEKCLFEDFQTDYPLKTLKDEQDRIHQKLKLDPFCEPVNTIAGMDVSYSPEHSFASYTVVDVESGELVWSRTVSIPTSFPYIPGFLAYRELPVYLNLIDQVRKEKKLAPVTLVDGNGILHPQKAGIACQLGYYANLRTIGVAKSLLCGNITNARMRQAEIVEYQAEQLGVALNPLNSKKPLYLSPGHKIDLESSLEMVLKVMKNHRLPEPVYQADRISRLESKNTPVE